MAVLLPCETVREARAAVVRERVLDAVCELIAAGDDVTFAKVAAAAGFPSARSTATSPTVEALIDALFDHINRRIGFDGELPTTADGDDRHGAAGCSPASTPSPRSSPSC